MTTYQEMVFGTNGNNGYVRSVSEDYFGNTYGYTYSGYYDSWVDYGGSPYYSDYYDVGQAYQNPATVPTTPTVIYQEQFNVPSATPIARGLHSQIETIADLGAVGDAKTVQMETNRFRTLTRTGQDSYSWKDTDKYGNVLASGSSRSDGVLLTNQITFQPAASPAQALPSSPVVLVETPTGAKITTADVPTVGASASVTTPDGGLIIVSRAEDGSYQYYEHKGNSGIVTPAKQLTPGPSGSSPQSSYSAAPSVAPIVELASSAPTASKPAAGSPKPALSFPDRSETKPLPSAETPYNIYYQMLDDEARERLTSGLDSKGKGEGLPGEEDQDLTGEEAAGKGKGEGLPGEEDSILHVQEAIEEEEEKDEGWVPDWIEKPVVKAFGRAKDPFERLYASITEPEVESTSEDTESDKPAPSVPAEEKKNPLMPDVSKKPVIPELPPNVPEEAASPGSFVLPDDDIPRTEEQKQAATKAWLKTKQDYYGLTDKEIDNLSKYFSPMLPAMTQNKVDLKKVAASAQTFEDLINGKPEAFEQFDYTLLNNLDTSGDFKGFESLPENDQKYVLQKWNEKMMDDNIPAIVQASFNAGVYNHLTRNPKTKNVAKWWRKGGLLKAIEDDVLWQGLSSANDFLHSKNGMAAIGLTFQTLATIGGFMAGGPVGAATVAGTTPFSATEVWQTWGDNPFATKANLQLDANYAWDYSSQHDQLFNTAKDAVDDMGFKANSNDPQANLNLISRAKDAVDKLGKSLKDNYVMLQATGTYDAEVDRYDILTERLKSGESQFSSTGEFDKKQYQASYADFRNIPSGYHVEWNGETRASGDHKIRAGDGTTESTVIAINDETGERIPLGSVKVQPFGQDTIYDVGTALEKALSYKKGGSSSDIPQHQTFVLNTKPSTKVEINGKVFQRRTEDGIDVNKIDVSVPGYYQVKITEADGQVEEKRVYIGAGQSLSIAEPTRKAESSSIGLQGLQTYLSPGDKLVWSSGSIDLDVTKYIDPETGLIAFPKPGYYTLSVIDAKGNKATKSVYIEKDTFNVLAIKPEEPKTFTPYQRSSGGSGGGGGGGGSSRSSRGSSYRPPAEEPTLIKYGETCRDADIWQDEIRVYPEIDTAYSIEPGYHSIRIERIGKKPWTKTVYCAKGDTITVSPAFEDLEYIRGEEEGEEVIDSDFPKRVFINSNPSGAKVLVNGSASGQWTPCYLDLPKGYYTFTIVKSGYDPYDILCYVGSIIAWNDQAKVLAQSEGMI